MHNPETRPEGRSQSTPVQTLDDVLTPKEAAAYLKVKEKTLANWRWHQMRGPAWSKLDPGSRTSRVRYRRSDLDAWLAKGQQEGA